MPANDIEQLREELQQNHWNDLEWDNLFSAFLLALQHGSLRTATRTENGSWVVDPLVKTAILNGFRRGHWQSIPAPSPFLFSDKHSMLPTSLPLQEHNIRIVPGGSTVRCGAHLGHNVTLMPPCYINIGAFIDDDTMIDSHALVGSCAQVGKRCHISAAAQLGGVLEPIGQLPVIIEDDVFVGGNCGIYEGTLVRQGAVLAAGTILTRGSRVYDVVRQHIIRPEPPHYCLEIPPYAVVISGSRPLAGDFASQYGLQAYTPIIIKYRDAKTSASTTLEEALR